MSELDDLKQRVAQLESGQAAIFERISELQPRWTIPDGPCVDVAGMIRDSGVPLLPDFPQSFDRPV